MVLSYQQARKVYLGIVAASVGITVVLYIISNPEITIEYFAIHMAIVLAGFSWLKKKRLSLV